MYIEPLYMAIAEKNDDADHTGKLYVIQKIEQFLNSTLPQLPKKAYNHYQSYVGFTYKLDFEPGEMRNSGQVMYIDI